MRFLKYLFFTILVVPLIGILGFVILPKGLILMYFIHKYKVNLVAERIEETVWGANFYGIHARVKGIEVKIPYVSWSLNQVKIPCKNGKAVLKYIPFEKFVFKADDFLGECVGTQEFKKLSGKVVFDLKKGFSGKLKVFNPNAELNFKGKYVFIRVTGLGFSHKIKIF
ncbi:MAG: hypothetical protein GXO57_06115 [Thermodesulfobacteria bacterium]|nr:hypothetical protein [Thermodesulfobacteriota bacterium]